MLREFKEFISKGNVLDMAVGVIIGSAFGKIVTSVVNDLLMPIIGIFSGGIDFSNLSIRIGGAIIKYGSFIQNVIDFLIIAACIFFIVKFTNKLNQLNKKKKEEKTSKKIPEDIKLLMEIRDLLKNENKKTKKQSK